MKICDRKILFRSSLNKWINGLGYGPIIAPESTVGSQALGRLGSDSRTNIGLHGLQFLASVRVGVRLGLWLGEG